MLAILESIETSFHYLLPPTSGKENSMAFYRVQITTEGRDIRTVRKQYPQASVVKIDRNKSRSDRLTDARSLIEDAQSGIEELRDEEMRVLRLRVNDALDKQLAILQAGVKPANRYNELSDAGKMRANVYINALAAGDVDPLADYRKKG